MLMTDVQITQGSSRGLSTQVFLSGEAEPSPPTDLMLHPVPTSAIRFLPFFPKSGKIGPFKKSVEQTDEPNGLEQQNRSQLGVSHPQGGNTEEICCMQLYLGLFCDKNAHKERNKQK